MQRMLNQHISFKAYATFNRPSNTTAYAAGDAVNNSTSEPTAMEFTIADTRGSHFVITRAILVSSNPAATPISAKIHLFNTTFTPSDDNAATAFTDALADTGGMKITFDDTHSNSNNYTVQTENLWSQGQLATTDTKLYGTLESIAAYTPVSGETFSVYLYGFVLGQ